MDNNTPPKKKRVGFTPEDPAETRKDRPRSITMPAKTPLSQQPSLNPALTSPTESVFTNPSRNGSDDALIPQPPAVDPGRAHLPQVSAEATNQIRAAFMSMPPRPRPALRRGDSMSSITPELPDLDTVQDLRAKEAHERGKRLERNERINSAPVSRRPSPAAGGRGRSHSRSQFLAGDIPLEEFAVHSDAEEGDSGHMPKRDSLHNEVHKLVQSHTFRASHVLHHDHGTAMQSGAVTPVDEREVEYVPKPNRYRGGILGALLKLYNDQPAGTGSGSSSPILNRASQHRSSALSGYDSVVSTPAHSPPDSGTSTPISGRSSRQWFSKNRDRSSSLAHLVGSSAMGGSPVSGLGDQVAERLRQQQHHQSKRPSMKRNKSSTLFGGRQSRPRLDDEIRITIHIAETIARQRYLIKLCRALMQYGAPTHRLEEYMKMSARVLEIDAQFLYIPGSMIVSFDDQSTHTTEVKLVKVAQGLDLGRLSDTHEIYKDVIHDRLGVEEATRGLEEIMGQTPKHSKKKLIFVFGIASAAVGPFAFSARLIDLPVAWLLGCILGFLQLVVAPRSDLYANVFEVGAAVITSFLARAFGSIGGGNVFCFSALAQSSIALILPGYTVLCASLELQSRSLVAGSVRMVYAIIYSLFLGFGITIGTAIYGIFDENASSETTCRNPLTYHSFFLAVPVFTICLVVINQGKWSQAPIMTLIAFIGYIVNYFSALRFAGNTQVSNTLGALAIGIMANMYSRLGARVENWMLDVWEDQLRPRLVKVYNKCKKSNPINPLIKLEDSESGTINDAESSHFVRHTRRVGYGLAAAAMLPAIFVQVPSGLAVSGSLISGIAAANQISGNATNGTTVVNSTSVVLEGSINSIAFNVGFSVIQVAIGITVGLFLSAIVVYPLGKRRSGLFSF